MNQIILHFSSQNDENQFFKNTFLNSRFQLSQEISLTDGDWYCAIVEFNSTCTISNDIYLCCDFIDQSFVNGQPIRVLKALKGTPRGRIYYPIETPIRLSVAALRNINIYMSGDYDKESYLNKSWSLTLRIFQQL